MKKLLILGGIFVVGFTSIAAPSILVVNGFMDSLKQYQPQTDKNQDESAEKEVGDSNQGFKDITKLNLKSDLGEVNDISETFMINKIKEVNKVLEDEAIYIKSMTLKKIKITVKDYIGTFNLDFKVTNLKELIKNKDLGKIKNIKSTTIIDKIKELNPNIQGMDFINDIDLKVVSLSEIKLGWKDNPQSNEEISLSYEVLSLDGILLHKDLGVTNDITEKWISNRILEINPDVAFLKQSEYQVIISDSYKQTPENSAIQIKKNNEIISFQNGNSLLVTYNVNDITALIKNTDLGLVDKLDYQTILNKVKELNPIFAQYNKINKTKIEFDLNSATLSNTSLANVVNLKYKVENLSALITQKNIGDISNYSNEESGKLIYEAILKSNTVLKKISINDFNIKEIKIGDFGENDAVIKGVNFSLEITGYKGIVGMSFNIKRTKISTFFKVKNLGKVSWIKPADITQKIKDVNGANFNESELIFSTPTYTKITLKSKENSLTYYGSVEFSYETIFKKDNNFDLRKATKGSITGETFDSQQDVPTYNQTPDNSSFELRYAIPNGYDNLIEYGKTNIKFNISTKATKMAAKSPLSAAELRKYDKENIILSYDLANGSSSGTKELRSGTSIPVPFKSGFLCGSSTNINFSSNFSYSINKETENSVDYIVIVIWISSKLAYWSACSSLSTSWSIIINSIEVL
ncbi:hypothetical protein [Spiroplasma endosymbiont of Diplazon laetatorius]|uniref:hypothetical protein n=1 Tax=Spiroplasma endosymbiont of Diplazon laetatorius TaxID=3066322 RepID=UPI0030CD38EA